MFGSVLIVLSSIVALAVFSFVYQMTGTRDDLFWHFAGYEIGEDPVADSYLSRFGEVRGEW